MNAEFFIKAVLLPFAIAWAGAQLTIRFKAPSERAGLLVRGWSNRLGLYGALMFGAIAIVGPPRFPAVNALDWIFYLSVVGLVWSFLEVKILRRGKSALRFLLLSSIWALVFNKDVVIEDLVLPAWVFVLVVALLTSGLWKLSALESERVSNRVLALVAVGTSLLTTITFYVLQTVHMFHLAMMVTAAMLPFLFVQGSEKTYIRGLIGVHYLMTTTLLLFSWRFEEMPAPCLVLALAPALVMQCCRAANLFELKSKG